MRLLDRLDEVRTTSSSDEHLRATDLAYTLRAWLVPDDASAAVRDAAAREGAGVIEHAQAKLFSTVWNQGNCFDGSESVVPFFVEATLDPSLDAPRRRFALDLLLHLAMGLPMERYPVRCDPSEYHALADSVDDPEARCASHARSCHGLVREALPRLASLVEDAQNEVAIGAWMLLGFLGGPVALEALRRGVAREDGDRLASVLVGLAWWDPSAMVAAATTALRSAHRNLALHAAAALAVAEPDSVCDEAVAVLAAPLGEFEDALLPQHIEGEGLVVNAIAALRGGPWLRAVDLLAARYEAGDDEGSLRWRLMEATFLGREVPSHAAALAPAQRRALEALARATPSDEALRTLAGWRLPTTREALRAWLER